MSGTRIFAGLLLLAGIVVGCGSSSDSGSHATPCTTNAECQAPATCVNKVCVVTCSSNAECKDGQYCNLETKQCQTGCKADNECKNSFVCRKGSCFDPTQDLDGDHFPAATDCDDMRADVNPAAKEVCDGVDNNCNNAIDEALPPGGPATKQQGVCKGAVQVCGGKAGYVDPDYSKFSDKYEATETSCDGLDNDCNGLSDEGLVPPPASKSAGVCAGAVKHCDGSSGWTDPDYSQIAGYESYESGDCDGIDSDCDGIADQQWDQDKDGFYSSQNAACVSLYQPKGLIDCDDQNAKYGKDCIIYVNQSASGLMDGTSWANAFTNLSDALASAKVNYQLWVAAGTYTPDVGVGVSKGDISASFQLVGQVAVYGGFKGDETSLGARNFRTNKTTLSGDLAGDDAPNFANVSDNSQHVLRGDQDAVLDGFWVIGGNAPDTGGGLLCPGSSDRVTIRNSTFMNNRASGNGGAIYAYWDSSPTIVNSRFINNQASSGGAIYTDWASEPTIYGSLFSGNNAGSGGALYIHWTQNGIIVKDSTFANNTAASGGAAVFDWITTAEITNSVLFGNGATPVVSNPLTVSYTCIEGGSLGGANVNLSASPFVDINGADNVAGNADDDLHLVAGSPCLESGDNTAVPSELTLDLDGNARIKGTVDRGAYEKP